MYLCNSSLEPGNCYVLESDLGDYRGTPRAGCREFKEPDPSRMHGLAWLGLALVARHRGVTKEKTLRNLLKS
jgi:hypothetical protein